MSEALGDQFFIEPLSRDGDLWTGRVVDRGAKALKFSTIKECDKVTYLNDSIKGRTKYGNVNVHIVWYEDVISIVYPK